MSDLDDTIPMKRPGQRLDFSEEGYKEVLLRIAGAKVWLDRQKMELAALAFEDHRHKAGERLGWDELREHVMTRFGLTLSDASFQKVANGQSWAQLKWRHEGLIGD